MKLEEEKLILSSGEYLVSDLAAQFKIIPMVELAKFFKERKLKFDRRVRMAAMRKALRPFVLKTRYECLKLDSRLNYRLLWFSVFSEYQMSIFFSQFDNEKMQTSYAEDLFSHMIYSLIEKDKNEKVLIELIELADRYQKTVDKRIKIDPDKLNAQMDEVFVDLEGMLDGLEVKDFRPILYNSATKDQLIALGKKYGIEVPSKLSGDGLREYVRGMLEIYGLLTPENKEICKSGRPTDVKALAVANNIKIAIELNKKQVIEFILQRAKTTKNIYVLPESDSVYEMSIPINDDERRYEKLLLEANKLETELAKAKNDILNLQDKERQDMEKFIAEKESLLKQIEEQREAEDKKEIVLKEEPEVKEEPEIKIEPGTKSEVEIKLKVETEAKKEPEKEIEPEVVEKVPNNVVMIYMILGYVLAIGTIVFIFLTAYLK